MNIETLMGNFRKRHIFGNDEILAIRTDGELRKDLVNYFKTKQDRHFALVLLDTFIELRKDGNHGISIDDLMLASFLLGMHGQVEDCLKIWQAKYVDFDTYCGVDWQLIPFAGVDQTISFLQAQTDDEAKKALEYVLECDPDDVTEYYNETPWWV